MNEFPNADRGGLVNDDGVCRCCDNCDGGGLLLLFIIIKDCDDEDDGPVGRGEGGAYRESI